MNDAPLTLFDILPMVDHSSNLVTIVLIVLTLIFTLFIALWYRYFTPFAKLQRALINHSISPRHACHQLAGMTNDKELLQELNRIRFQRVEPSLIEVQTLIQRSRHVL
jgi:hypothetical protein